MNGIGEKLKVHDMAKATSKFGKWSKSKTCKVYRKTVKASGKMLKAMYTMPMKDAVPTTFGAISFAASMMPGGNIVALTASGLSFVSSLYFTLENNDTNMQEHDNPPLEPEQT